MKFRSVRNVFLNRRAQFAMMPKTEPRYLDCILKNISLGLIYLSFEYQNTDDSNRNEVGMKELYS